MSVKQEKNYRELFQSESEFLTSTVEAARDWVRDKIMGKGCYCPVCDKWTKVYRNRFYSLMARKLIWMYHQPHNKFRHTPTHMPRALVAGGKTGYLEFWGLAKRSAIRQGFWRITQEGIDFVEGKIKIRKFIYMYNRELIEFKGMNMTEITIQEALDSDGFNFDEVMQTVKGE